MTTVDIAPKIDRRKFLVASLGATALATVPTWPALAQSRPTTESLRITSVRRRDDTIVRSGGYGWVAGMTWTADDRQLAAIGEGMGWPGHPEDLHFQGGLVDVGGSPQETRHEAIPGYPILATWMWFRPGGDPIYSPSGILAVDNVVYQYLESFHGTAHWDATADVTKGESNTSMPRLSCTKLIYSMDHGRTWRNQDGTPPVYFEQPKDQSRESMIFWDEPRGLFGSGGLMLLQMGRGIATIAMDTSTAIRELWMSRMS